MTMEKLETGNCTAVILLYNRKENNEMRPTHYHVCCAYLNYKLIMRALRIYVDIRRA